MVWPNIIYLLLVDYRPFSTAKTEGYIASQMKNNRKVAFLALFSIERVKEHWYKTQDKRG
ncbi:Hypothetical protein Minf_0847 [Methylacidiphilum infernorum V4]|uniref:Uncharacterized protein n=1 Tax=Methylacidiphilum infernorum (isolate V4) TaxID=481448 RepID=B3E1A6_METI4|nr:Hypothetical protein Minf_0847 [Methylacidiphilum infernorum V4]